jgi:hypothetical protein
MGLEDSLVSEINKWSKKIEKETEGIKIKDKDKEHFITNIQAYIKDSKHFLAKGDLVRSFEAIIWAWSWLEILKELRILE